MIENLSRLWRGAHVQTQGIVDTLAEALVVLDSDFCIQHANKAFYDTFMLQPDSAIGRNMFEAGDGHWNVADFKQHLAEVIPNSKSLVGYLIESEIPSRGRLTLRVSARRIDYDSVKSNAMLLAFEDVTEHSRAHQEKDMLLSEMQHRMKNMLAVVRALARQTEAHGRTGEQYRDAFLGRFEAMLLAQDLFQKPEAIAVETLLAKMLDSVVGRQARIGPGPRVDLPSVKIMPLSMIFHELTTNALKYGALSVDCGIVHVQWDIEAASGTNLLAFRWREENGPAVAPPTSLGFGSRLIQFSASRELGGSAELHYEPAGLDARITMPL